MTSSASTTVPTKRVVEEAAAALRTLGSLRKRETGQLRVTCSNRSEKVAALPREAIDLLLQVLGHLAEGRAVTLVPTEAELTTQQAADILNVSRPYLVKQLEDGKLPFRRVGTRRRILFKDLLEYRARDDEERRRAADELTRLSQELGDY